MKILLTNDDGIHAEGLNALEAIACELSDDIFVCAPEYEQSGASRALTLSDPIRVRKLDDRRYAVTGTPTDCVHLALTGLLNAPPDVVVSGINFGANMGDDTIYSGTVAAATEGFLFGLPSIAMSLASKAGRHFDTAAAIAVQLVQRFGRAPFGGGDHSGAAGLMDPMGSLSAFTAREIELLRGLI